MDLGWMSVIYGLGGRVPCGDLWRDKTESCGPHTIPSIPYSILDWMAGWLAGVRLAFWLGGSMAGRLDGWLDAWCRHQPAVN